MQRLSWLGVSWVEYYCYNEYTGIHQLRHSDEDTDRLCILGNYNGEHFSVHVRSMSTPEGACPIATMGPLYWGTGDSDPETWKRIETNTVRCDNEPDESKQRADVEFEPTTSLVADAKSRLLPVNNTIDNVRAKETRNEWMFNLTIWSRI